MNHDRECWRCELEFVLKERSDGLRLALQRMNPTTDGYHVLFGELVAVDGDRRTLRESITMPREDSSP